jgi:hypothetical protein
VEQKEKEELRQMLEDLAPNLCKHSLIMESILEDICGRERLSLSHLKLILELEQLYQRTRPQI